MVTIHWSKPICKEPGNYIAWPTIVCASDGELLVVFSGDRDEHVCPYGKNKLIRSSDQGETWSAPVIINNSPLDDRDSGLLQLSNGDLVMTTFTAITVDQLDYYREMLTQGISGARWTAQQVDSWERHCSKVMPETRERWKGCWTRRSSDGGHTWEPHVESIVTAPHGPRETADGTLVYVGTADVAGRPAVVCAESRDHARSWQKVGMVAHIDDYSDRFSLSEPHVIEVDDGGLLCLMRTNDDEAGLHACRSADGGRSWSMPEPTGMVAFDNPPHLLRLADGRLLCTYGQRQAPFGERACLSVDEGRTWLVDDQIVLCDAPDTDLGYPATAEISPGELLSVYYQRHQPGEKVSINATRWSLER